MVKVSVKRTSSTIEEIIIAGHADYANNGQDLVCAGVSSITFGSMNALDTLANGACDFSVKKSRIKIQTKQEDRDAQLLLEAMIFQLKTLEESYQNYIKINDQEV